MCISVVDCIDLSVEIQISSIEEVWFRLKIQLAENSNIAYCNTNKASYNIIWAHY